jgi:hypothetical protein
MGRARLPPCRPEPFKLRGLAPRRRAEPKRILKDFLCAGFIPGSRLLFFSPQRSRQLFPSWNRDLRKLTGLKVGQPPAAALSEVEVAARFCLARLCVELHWPSYSTRLSASDGLAIHKAAQHCRRNQIRYGQNLARKGRSKKESTSSASAKSKRRVRSRWLFSHRILKMLATCAASGRPRHRDSRPRKTRRRPRGNNLEPGEPAHRRLTFNSPHAQELRSGKARPLQRRPYAPPAKKPAKRHAQHRRHL